MSRLAALRQITLWVNQTTFFLQRNLPILLDMQADETTASASKKPGKLFRYFDEKAAGIFAKPELRFASIVDFNDIFEMMPRLDGFIRDSHNIAVAREYTFLPLVSPAEKAISWQEFKNNNERQRLKDEPELCKKYQASFQQLQSNAFGVVCFSENVDSLLMWGHYTNCHRGFVVEFDPKHSFFIPGNFRKVSYSKSRVEFSLNLNQEVVFQKNDEWAYEQEYRLAVAKKELYEGEAGEADRKPKKYYYLPLQMDSVKAVYLGCRIADDDKSKLMAGLASYPHVEVFAMEPHSIEYKLNAVRVPRVAH